MLSPRPVPRDKSAHEGGCGLLRLRLRSLGTAAVLGQTNAMTVSALRTYSTAHLRLETVQRDSAESQKLPLLPSGPPSQCACLADKVSLCGHLVSPRMHALSPEFPSSMASSPRPPSLGLRQVEQILAAMSVLAWSKVFSGSN